MSREQGGARERTEDLSNEGFRLLVQRSTLLDDVEATEDLQRYLLTKIHKKARVFGRAFGHDEGDDLVAELLDTGFRVARRTLEKQVDKPRNYVIRALTNRYVDLLRRAQRRAAAEVLTDLDEELADPDPHDHDYDDADNAAELERFRRDQPNGTGRKVAQVIQLVYLLDVSESEACELMDFGATERETVLRTIRRWRNDPASPLRDAFRRGREGSR